MANMGGKGVLGKMAKAHREGRLYRRLRFLAKLWFRKALYIFYDQAGGSVRLHCPEYVEPDKADRELAARIFTSFKRMKEDQAKASSCYSPSSFWQGLLDKAYRPMAEAVRDGDLNRFHFFLSNFGTWKEWQAIESTDIMRSNMRSFVGRRYLKNEVFFNQLKMWKWVNNGRKELPALSYPAHGNQSGAYIDGNFVGVGSFFNEIYGSILSGLIREIDRPIVAELGAGYGKMAYFTLRYKDRFSYVDFDLPETLCLAAYYLIKAFPGKKSLLYKEEEFSPVSYAKYDLIFMPAFEISKAGDSSVDLFLNKNSLGEMTAESVHSYVGCISKATRGYFFHMNHDIHPNVYDNGERGMLSGEYPVPEDKFSLIFRYPDIGHMLYQGFVDFGADIFIYLYKRINAYGRREA